MTKHDELEMSEVNMSNQMKRYDPDERNQMHELTGGDFVLFSDVEPLIEQWVPIQHHQHYEVSSLGRVRSLPHGTTSGKVLKQTTTSNGYKRIVLRKNGLKKNHLVHRLVAAAFLGYDKSLQVNHKDGCKINNLVTNLEWCSASDNMKHRSQILKKGNKVRSQETYDKIFSLHKQGLKFRQIAKKLNLLPTTVYWALNYSTQALSAIGMGE